MAQTAQQMGQQALAAHLPPNLTTEGAQKILFRYQQLKANGTPDTDPELRQLHQQLVLIRQRTQQKQAQKAHQADLAQQPNAKARPNGEAKPAPVANASWVTPAMRALLRDQIKAFGFLSKNMPLPVEVQEALFVKSKKPAPKEATTLPPLSQGSKTLTSPYTFLKDYIPYDQHNLAANRIGISSILPAGVDVEKVREERENIIHNRLVERRKELEREDANQDSWDPTKSVVPQPDGSRKRRALIEYKKIALLQRQRALRQQVSREMVMADTQAMTANRAMYRRQKRHDIREARFTEKLEREQRNARESKEKAKHAGWLAQIQQHAKEVHDAAEEQANRVRRLGRLMITQHQTIEKEEQKRVERTAKQRLQALKANDEETYLKLLGQAKDTRISHLLKQTDNFLGQLAASVKTQQRSAGGRQEPSPEPDEDAEEDDPRRVDYYEVAHKVKEEVKEQSSNLIGGLLKEYQLKGLQWMVSLYNNNLNGILADEMGLGKTIQSISLITYLIEKKRQRGPYLVIVPLSTLTNWNNEFEKWAPSVQRIVYKGAPNSRKAQQMQIRSGQFQVLLTTYEYIIKDRPVLGKIKWLHMIVDEGHRMKNAQSKLSNTITQYYSTRYRLILTGTPLQNNLPELWALLNFVLPNIFKSVKSFEEWFNTPFANTGSTDKMELTEEEQILVIRRLHKVLRPFLLRRLKKDVEKDLPEKQERVIKCNMSALQARLYTQLKQRQQSTVRNDKGGIASMRGLSNMLMQLRKLCNHPFVFEEVETQMNPSGLNNDLLWRTAGKFELLDRILPKFQATGHRVLMFFQMTQIMNIMEDFMRLRGIQYLRLDGATKSEDRSELLGLFNAPDSPYFCFLLSTRAGGLGLNLQTADTVVIFDSDWNPFQDLQAQDRAHRIGQKNEVRILRLITSSSVEEKILERAQFKLQIDGKVIQAGKFDNKSTNDERDAMLRVMLETTEAAEDLQNEEMDDEDLNQIMMRNEDELIVFRKLDEERHRDPQYGDDRLPRLLSEAELPDIFVADDNASADEVVEFVGRGARERTKVRYDDGLTEEQWLDAVDNDEDTIEEAIARKQAKVQRRQTTKDKKGGRGSEVASPLPSRDVSSSPPPPPPSAKKQQLLQQRGRTKGKRKADEMSQDGDVRTPSVAPPAAKKRGKMTGKPVETLAPAERAALQLALDRIYEAIDEMEVPFPEGEPDEPTRAVIDPFIQLPDKKLYPDYYNFVKEPISMEIISKRINDKRYQGLDDFVRDMQLLVNNCRIYNEDSSMLYIDAGVIETKTLELVRAESDAHQHELGKAAYRAGPANGDAGSANGASAPASAAGTPVPPPAASGTKLKLNFGAR